MYIETDTSGNKYFQFILKVTEYKKSMGLNFCITEKLECFQVYFF